MAEQDQQRELNLDRWADVPDFPPKTPPLDPRLVKKFVAAAHGNLKATTEMLEEFPTLLNATWDWGSGDFESAIEGAGHMGNTEIANLLLSKGARMNIFCGAMLGHLELVQTLLEARPNLKDSKGPHGLTLIHHAKAGGEASRAVLKYLESL
jgi:ankyrin repeat protein